MSEQEYSIQELCDRTGLPRRTIHFYTQQEIIPPPASSGLGARYQRIHLVRLNLIPIFRQQGLRLDDIRQKFLSSSPDELEKILAVSEKPGTTPKIEPAPDQPSPAVMVAQTCLVYNLPQGVVVMVPSQLAAHHRLKIEELCQNMEHELAKD
jgi:DNA-binding transcriptional MerR regulator